MFCTLAFALQMLPGARGAAIAITAACAALAVGTSVQGARVGFALVLAFTFLGCYGWRLAVLGTERWQAPGSLDFWRGFFAANALILAVVPIKLALGIRLMGAYWPGENLVPYLFGIVVGLTAWPDDRVTASGRQNTRVV